MEDFILQGTEEWMEQRRGKFTASEVHRLMGAKGLEKTGKTYILKCVSEEFGGYLPEVNTMAMEFGRLTEPFAIAHYEKVFGVEVEKMPFLIAEWCDQAGSSPDGFVSSKNKGIEVKCPFNPVNHIAYMLISTPEELKILKPEYYWQIMMGIAVLDVPSWDFVSYSESFIGAMKMCVLNVTRNESDIVLLKNRVLEAVKMKNELVNKIKERAKIWE